jgi:hypothetical protein
MIGNLRRARDAGSHESHGNHARLGGYRGGIVVCDDEGGKRIFHGVAVSENAR